MSFCSFAAVLALGGVWAHAGQKPRIPKTGCITSTTEELASAYRLTTGKAGGKRRALLPSKIDLRNSGYMPPVGNQKKNDCVAWATAYYAYTFSVAQRQMRKEGDVSVERYVFSPQYLYPHINGGADSGATVSSAMRWLVDHGCATLQESPYKPTDATSMPSAEAEQKAARYRAREAVLIADRFSKAFDPELAKQFIATTNQPIVINLHLLADFPAMAQSPEWRRSPSFVYSTSLADTRENSAGNHAMAIVGYDESKKAFLLANSWGREWGADGFLWISEDTLKQHLNEAWGFIPGGYKARVDPPQPIPFANGVFVAEPPADTNSDTAVLVGINRYPNLPARAQLEACVNDVHDVAAALRKYGFSKVVTLENEKATRSGILDALRQCRSLSPKDRFVFFFAGHGSRSVDQSGSVILPSDADNDITSPQISKQELAAEISAIPSKMKTVMLDSCFAGGMVRSLKKGPKKVRFWKRTRATDGDHLGTKDLIIVNGADRVQAAVPQDICMLAGAMENQVAGESYFGDRPCGIFTHFLAQELNGASKPWGDVMLSVASKVQTETDGDQQPTYSPQFRDKLVFNADEPVQPPQPKPEYSLWDQYVDNCPDPSVLRIEMVPGTMPVAVGSLVKINIQVKHPGWLIVIEKGTSGKINLLSPLKINDQGEWTANGTTAEAKVGAGAVKHIPDDDAVPGDADPYFKALEPGTESIKALLFTNEEAAATVLRAFGGKLSLSQAEAKKRKLRDFGLVSVKRQGGQTELQPFYSSTISFDCVAPSGGEVSYSKPKPMR